jgi:hypothetical protein
MSSSLYGNDAGAALLHEDMPRIKTAMKKAVVDFWQHHIATLQALSQHAVSSAQRSSIESELAYAGDQLSKANRLNCL